MAVSPGNRGKGYGPMIIDSVYSWYLSGDVHAGLSGNTVAVRKLFARPVDDDYPAAMNTLAIAEKYQEAA